MQPITTPAISTSTDSISNITHSSLSKFIPVAKEDLGVVWETLDVDDVLRFSDGEVSSVDLYITLRYDETHKLWLYPGGWVITGIWSKWIDLVAWKDISKGTLSSTVVEFFSKMAKELNYRGIRFVTLRNPKVVLRRAKPFGFKIRMVEYVKDNSFYLKDKEES